MQFVITILARSSRLKKMLNKISTPLKLKYSRCTILLNLNCRTVCTADCTYNSLSQNSEYFIFNKTDAKSSLWNTKSLCFLLLQKDVYLQVMFSIPLERTDYILHVISRYNNYIKFCANNARLFCL